MSLNKIFKTTGVLLLALFLFTPLSYSGIPTPTTDESGFILYSFFDLRDRESFVQVTNVDSGNATVHVQIWDVSNNCNENNFFDNYTPADTHIYNMRDILTNDTNPSGVVLPEGAYGFVTVGVVTSAGGSFDNSGNLVGNFRIEDNNGYEYRTNSVFPEPQGIDSSFATPITFNFNTEGNINLSDVVGLVVNIEFSDGEVLAANLIDNWVSYDVDIYDLNEVPFSCRNVIFACTDQNNPLLEGLLEFSGDASVASFEYGINNAIPHTKGGELLCPNNIVSEGFVTLEFITRNNSSFFGFTGLNNGNGRGSMDSWWHPNALLGM